MGFGFLITKILIFLPWMFLITPLIFVSTEVVYFKRFENESVDLFCAFEKRYRPSIGFYLKHKYLQMDREVLFFQERRNRTENDAYKGRISVGRELDARMFNVTISQLRWSDTGQYFCEFIQPSDSEDTITRGTTEFFLVVEVAGTIGDCKCHSYRTLLYTISAAVGLLLLLVVGLGISKYVNVCGCGEPRTPVPIYEDMAQVLTDG